MSTATVTFPVEVGALLRGQIRRALKTYCFRKGYKLTIDEDRGLFESLFLVSIEVPNDQGQQALAELKHWADSLEQAS